MHSYHEISIENKLSSVDRKFLLAVLERDYVTCTEMLLKGANVNEKFGKYAKDKKDENSNCGPNDTPLTHAVKSSDEKLVEFLLKHGANTEVFNADSVGDSPLMDAAYVHNVKIVKLLLDAGANPNTEKLVSAGAGSTAMHQTFKAVIGECFLNNDLPVYVRGIVISNDIIDAEKKECIEIFDLLMKAGFAGEYNDIINKLKPLCLPSALRAFTEIWKTHYNQELENSYTQGAAAGVFTTQISAENALSMGCFLDRRSGGRLAQTCTIAADTAVGERNRQANILKIKTSSKTNTLFAHYELERLVKKYTLPDTSQNSLEKGLRNAANNNKISDLIIFIKHVKNINAKDDNPTIGRTALHWAAVKGNEECYRFLLEANANPDIPDAAGKLAGEYLNKLACLF